MLDQLFNIVKNFGKRAVVDNPDVPNEYNQPVLEEATKTIAGGFQNVLAGGGLGNILDLFRRGKTNQRTNAAGLLGNPMVSMMVGYFINKLINKFKMKPAAASNVAHELIPNSVNDLVKQTNDPQNSRATLDNLIHSLSGGNPVTQNTSDEDGPLQTLLDKNDDGSDDSAPAQGGFNLQDMIRNIASKVQHTFQDQQENRKPGILDMIKGLMPN
jgi:hypothetical protein